jgi:hypothetical protein
MNKAEFLKSLTTEQLVAWRDRAEAVSGIYTHFNHTTNSTANFTLAAIVVELDRREDKPSRNFKKKHQ